MGAAPKRYLKQDRASHPSIAPADGESSLSRPQAALDQAALWKQYIRKSAHTFEAIGCCSTQMIGSKVLLELFSFVAKQNYATKRKYVGRA